MAWPFKRRNAADEGPAAPTRPEAGSPPQSIEASDPGWRSLPPMPSVVPVLVPMVQRKTTVDALTTWRAPELSLAPLGHALEGDGPSGRVATVTAEPLHAVSEAPAAGAEGGPPAPPPLSYVQRAPAAATTSVRRWTPPSTPTLSSVPSVEPSPSTRYVSAPPQVVPPLQLEALPSPPPSAPVQDAGHEPTTSDHDAPLVGETEPLAPSAQPTPQMSDAATAQRAPLDLPVAPVQRHADTDHGRGAFQAEPEDATPAVQRASLEAPTAPLVGVEPVPLRAPSDSPGPTTPGLAATPALPLNAPVQRRASERPVGLGRPISRAPIEPGSLPGPGAFDAPQIALASVQRASLGQEPEAAEEPVAPLLGSTAIRPSLQRSAEETADGDEPEGGGDALPLAQRAADGVAPAPAPDLDLPLPRHAAEPDAPQVAAPLVGSTPALGASSTSPALTPPTVQRAPAPTPDLPLAAPAPVEGPASASSMTSLSAQAQRAPLEESGLAIAPLVGESPLAAPDAAASGEAAGGPGATDAPAAAATAQDLPLAPSAAQRAPAEPAGPLEMSPLLGGRPFSLASVQRAASAPTPSSASGGPTPTGTTPADVSGASATRLSPEPGVYDPVLPIAVWNGAASPALPGGGSPDAPPGDIVATVQRSTGVDLSNVRIRRDTGPTVQRMEAKALTHEGEVHLPEERGSLHTTENRSLVAHELVHVAQQRTLGTSRPLESTPGGQHLELQAQHMEHATATGAPAPDLHLHTSAPIVQRAPFQAAPSPAASPFTPDQLSTLMSLADSPPTTAAPTIQRSAEPAADVPSPESSSDAPPAPGAAPEQDLDELADKLFPRFRRRWTRDMRSDRERHGNLTDLHR